MSDQSLELLMVTIGDSFLRDWEGEESTKEQMEELVDRLSLLKEKLHLPFVSNHPDTRMTEQQVWIQQGRQEAQTLLGDQVTSMEEIIDAKNKDLQSLAEQIERRDNTIKNNEEKIGRLQATAGNLKVDKDELTEKLTKVEAELRAVRQDFLKQETGFNNTIDKYKRDLDNTKNNARHLMTDLEAIYVELGCREDKGGSPYMPTAALRKATWWKNEVNRLNGVVLQNSGRVTAALDNHRRVCDSLGIAKLSVTSDVIETIELWKNEINAGAERVRELEARIRVDDSIATYVCKAADKIRSVK